MKSEKNSKFVIGLCALALVASVVYYFWSSANSNPSVHAKHGGPKTRESRSPASIKPKDKLQNKNSPQANSATQTDRQVVKTRATAIPSNPINENWKEILLSGLEQQAGEDIKVELIESRPHIYQKHDIAIAAQKVKIRLTRKDGLVSAFTALVHATTGQVIQTWDRTHFETKVPLYEPIEARPLIATQTSDGPQDN